LSLVQVLFSVYTHEVDKRLLAEEMQRIQVEEVADEGEVPDALQDAVVAGPPPKVEVNLKLCAVM